MSSGADSTVSRRRLLHAGGLLAIGTAGCTAPTATPTGGSMEISESIRRRAREVGAANRSAVVVLQPVDGPTSGTAWFLDGGQLLTNAHVIDELGSDALEAHALDGSTFEVTVEHRTDTPDLALLTAGTEPPATLLPGDSTDLELGQPLVQIGHVRLGYWTISVGRFRRRVDLDGRSWLLTDLPTMLGNSGSPVFTLDGDVVGLTFGDVPKAGTGPSERPTPGSTAVYASYPRRQVEFAGHLAIETVREYLSRWTGTAEWMNGP